MKGELMSTTKIGLETIYYDEYGSGEPIILIPGLGGTRFGWIKQLVPFSKKYRVINIDNRDGGNSEQSASSYDINDMTNDVVGLIENLNLGSVYVVGISMGGFIAQYLALKHPEYIKKMVLVSTSSGGSSHVYPKPEIFSLLNHNPNEDVKTRVRNLQTLITGPGFVDNHPEDIERAVEYAIKLPMPHEAYQRQLSAAKTHNKVGTREYLSRISVPTLVIHGECDPIMPYPNGQVLATEIPGAKFLSLPNVGHLPHIEVTDTFNKAVLDFFK